MMARYFMRTAEMQYAADEYAASLIQEHGDEAIRISAAEADRLWNTCTAIQNRYDSNGRDGMTTEYYAASKAYDFAAAVAAGVRAKVQS